MTEAMEQVRALLAEHDPAGELARCGLRSVAVGHAVLDQLPEIVAEMLGPGSGSGTRVALLVDPTLITRGGADVKQLAEEALAGRFDVRRVVLDDGHEELHVSAEIVARAREAAAEVDAVVALGGGTISDIGKAATADLDGRVLVSVQTAASVDGYTDDVSVLLVDGVKRTVPTRWPDAVVADSRVVSEAPGRMNRAGFGEMTSMLTAPADWRLAALVGMEPNFHRAPLRLLDAVGRGLEDWAEGVSASEPESVESLTRALAVRGVVTGVAGTTATLSGVEHLISHMLDLHHAEHHLPMGLHGAQVGVGAVVAASAWQLLFDRLDGGAAPRLLDKQLDEGNARARVEAAFGHLGTNVTSECWRDYGSKLARVQDRRARVDRVLAEWPTHADELRSLVRPSGEIARALRSAGAAATFAELAPVVASDLARWAVSSCALMRDRFTAVDLLMGVGWWTPDDVQEVFARAAETVDSSGPSLVPGGAR